MKMINPTKNKYVWGECLMFGIDNHFQLNYTTLRIIVN